MSEEKRSSVIVPDGMQELADANNRSLAREAKHAMQEYVAKYRGNSKDRRKQRRQSR